MKREEDQGQNPVVYLWKCLKEEWNATVKKLIVFDPRGRKQLSSMSCWRDHKKRIAWTREFYDQSYQKRQTDREVPRLKLFCLLIARRRSFWIRRAVSVEWNCRYADWKGVIDGNDSICDDMYTSMNDTFQNLWNKMQILDWTITREFILR